ncbi:MAG TPA: DUF1269 domain-containing protein [Nocardioides sp.]|jgi:uncharacterized membrane protein|uniref:DUF1269 domain-containing protein n=1 Tax=Nocardioides sp. TaxID=35761 RepID=UPI002CEC6767|nr:DUF1269 domain-containing protein [Nocardioides sp.]HTW13647.1 DUF1269 domain-containing protein [Nocardioides sp.]
MSSSTLTVWLYDTPMGAVAGELRLRALHKRRAVLVLDAVTVIWIPGAHRPRIGHLRYPTSQVAAQRSVLGALVGAVLLPTAVPVTDPEAVGLNAWADRLGGTGIDQPFLEDVRSRIVPGTSALLVLSSDTDLDVVRPLVQHGLARGDVSLLRVPLGEGAVEMLRQVVDELVPRG